MGPRSSRHRLVGLLLTVLLGALAAPAVAAATDAAQTCDQPLAVLSPTDSRGELAAIAVTAQVLERDVAGWSEVTWETFAGADLTSLTIVRADGTEVLTDPPTSGSASNVLVLVACGTTGSGS